MNPTAVHHAPTTAELVLLRQSVREVLASLYPGLPEQDRAGSWPHTWGRLAAHGLWSTLEPPEGSLAAAAVVAEELGRVLYAGPTAETLSGSYVLAGLQDAGELPAIGDAGPPAVLVTADPMVAVPPETLLIVDTGGDAPVRLPAGATTAVVSATPDVTRRFVTVHLDAAPATVMASAHPQLVRDGRAARALLYCADTLGCVAQVLARTTDYARQRTTFGAPIGKYQGVAHRLVDHTITAQQLRLVLDDAVAACDDHAADRHRRVAVAETFFWGRAADLVSDCIQLAGAIGFTWEFGHHFYLRRILGNAAAGGGRPHHRLAQESTW